MRCDMPWAWKKDASGWQTRTWVDPKKSGSAQWWTCNVPDCVNALKNCGHKPQVNRPTTNTCSFCGLPWQTTGCVKDAKLKETKDNLRAKLAEAASDPPPALSKTQARRQRSKKAAAANSKEDHVQKKTGAQEDPQQDHA